MSNPDPALVAAAPALNTMFDALDAFFTNLGPDPAKVPLTLPGALLILQGTVALQLPAIATAEFGVVQASAHSTVDGWRKSLASKIAGG